MLVYRNSEGVFDNQSSSESGVAVGARANLQDNEFTDGWVIIAMVGDITGPDGWPDGKGDMSDIGLVAVHFGRTVPPAPVACNITASIYRTRWNN